MPAQSLGHCWMAVAVFATVAFGPKPNVYRLTKHRQVTNPNRLVNLVEMMNRGFREHPMHTHLFTLVRVEQRKVNRNGSAAKPD